MANGLASALLRLPSGLNVSQSAPQEERPAFRTWREGRPVPAEELPMQRSLATGQPIWNQEDTIRFDDGTEIILLINAMPLFDAQGHVRGGIATCLDVTAQRRVLRELQQARAELSARAEDLEKRVGERTEELNRTVRDLESFSYTVSHDLRSPLRAIQGYAQSVLEDFSSGLPEEAVRRLQRIDRAAQRLDRLVQEVLIYSRIARDKVTVGPVNLEEMIAGLVEVLPELHTVSAVFEVRHPLLPVLAQETLLSQCLSNLINNAFKFIPKATRPKVVVSTRAVAEGGVRLEIADNGIGIDSSHHGRIFEIFGRVYADDLYPGTGIGLAIVRKAVQQMGGTVGVDSALGHGSVFWMELRGADHA